MCMVTPAGLPLEQLLECRYRCMRKNDQAGCICRKIGSLYHNDHLKERFIADTRWTHIAVCIFTSIMQRKQNSA